VGSRLGAITHVLHQLRNASLSSVTRLFPKVKKTASGKHIETQGGVLKS
jgi:hypothetical protein